ncbi:hypothetical protein Tco_1299949 [Tanacetum coccineum]
MYSYRYSNLDKLIWLAETLKKGSPFAPDSEPLLRPYQLWMKARYEESLRKSDQMHQTFEKISLEMTHKLDDMIELHESQPKETYKEDLECEMVMVKMPRFIAWLGSTDTCDEHIGSLGMMKNEVGNTSPQDTLQILPLFEEYTLPVTYLKEVEETLGAPIEVEPLDKTQLEDLGLNTCNHAIPLSSQEVPSFDELEPQPNPLPNCSSLDVSLRGKRGPESPIKPHSPDSFMMKAINNLTIHTLPLPHVASFHLKDLYCYYHPCIDDLKKYYRFKPGLLRQSRSLGVDFLNLEMIKDDWELESKLVSFLGRALSLPIKPKELEKGRIKETHYLEHIIQQPLSTYGSFLPQWCVLLLSTTLDLKCRRTSLFNF